MEKELVTIVRKWHEPIIRIDVTTIGIGITMTLEDFVLALSEELKVDTLTLALAAERVVTAAKRETAKVM